MEEFDDSTEPTRSRSRSPATLWILTALAGLLVLGVVALQVFQPGPPPVPKELAGNPLLARGHGIFALHCVICHGETGRGDGPNAKDLRGPSPGNLTDPATWKHGRLPEQVETVIASGVGNTAMPGWEGVLGRDGDRAAAAYVLHLARLPVPDAWRVP